MDVIKIRSVFLWHNMHQYQLHGSHTERQARILTGNRKKRKINFEKYKNSFIAKISFSAILSYTFFKKKKRKINSEKHKAEKYKKRKYRNTKQEIQKAEEENQFRGSFLVISNSLKNFCHCSPKKVCSF